MLITRRALTAAGLFGLLPVGSAHAADASAWRAALREIVARIEAIHPNPFFDTERNTFLRQARALERDLPRLSDEQRMTRAMQLVASLGDGHTRLSPRSDDFRFWYPIRLYEFSDGYFVTAAHGEATDLAGAQVLGMAGRPAAEAIASARTLFGADNAFDRMERLHAVHNATLMRGLGLAETDGGLRIVARLPNGQTVARTLSPQRASETALASSPPFEWASRTGEVYGPALGGLDSWTTAFRGLPSLAFRTEDRTRPLHLMYRRARIAHALPEAGAYYIQANFVGDTDDQTFAAFTERALTEVDALRPRSMIVDLRYNPGGDGSTVPGVIHAFIRRGETPPWGNLYVLTGRRTFSAAIMLLAAFIDHTRPTLIGEPAGAALDHYGDATGTALPDIGANLNVSTLFHQLQDQGQRYDIMPVDVAATFSFADWSAGRDPAIDPILAGQEMRSIANIALADGGPAARAVFDQRRQRPHQDWMALREFDLIRTTWRLNDLNRRADAVEIARIMVALRSDSARAHSVLGQNLMELGQREEGLAAYREALRLDPYNLDNISQRAALAEAAQ